MSERKSKPGFFELPRAFLSPALGVMVNPVILDDLRNVPGVIDMGQTGEMRSFEMIFEDSETGKINKMVFNFNRENRLMSRFGSTNGDHREINYEYDKLGRIIKVVDIKEKNKSVTKVTFESDDPIDGEGHFECKIVSYTESV